MAEGFPLSTGSQEIPDVPPHCSNHCFVDNPVLLQRIVSRERTGADRHLESCVQQEKLEVHFGAGEAEKYSFDEANKRYMSEYFKHLDKESYCCPPVYEYKQPGKSFELHNDRGEHAEEHTVETFSTMFKKYDIPSFIIHGYNWKQQYLKVLKKLKRNISNLSKEVFKEEGEIDLLISLPKKCLFDVEVKAVGEKYGDEVIKNKVIKAFKQCAKTAEFLSEMIAFKEPICLIKVVALPNCTRATVNRLYCKICRAHIISDNDISGTSELNNWLTRITGQYSIQIKNSPLQLSQHLDIISRLIGPASLSPFKTPNESIERTAEQIRRLGGLEKVREVMKWIQLTPQQLHVKCKDPQFLMLFGPQGSGKTLLALSKAKEILEGGGKTKSVLYILVPKFSWGLLKMYKDELSKEQRGNCELHFKGYTVKYPAAPGEGPTLLTLIMTLKEKHPGMTLHVICDEVITPAQIFENPLVGMKEVGYVWLLVESFYYVAHEQQKILWGQIQGFEVIFLDKVMRMSRQNIEFANEVIQFAQSSEETNPLMPKLRAGHAINGLKPSVYRMKCVCREPRGDYICSDCTYTRINWLLIKAYYDLGLDLLKNPVQDHSSLKGLSLINLDSIVAKPDEETTSRQFMNYRGCEDKVIIMDLSDLLDFYNSFIGVTRSLGKIIILDVGCSAQEAPKYDEFINIITENTGIVEVKEVKPSEDDLKLMYQDWVLDIGKKVMKASSVLTNEYNFEVI